MQPTSFSVLRRGATQLVALSLLSTAGARSTPVARTAAPPPIRRSVALVVSIDAPTYWDRLDQTQTCGTNCRALQAALLTPVRSALATKFAFANWNASGSPPADTMLIRWLERPPPETPGSSIEFRLVGPSWRARSDSLRLTFEDFGTMIDRPNWAVDHVRDEWLRILTPILDRTDLVPAMFGKIPVNVQVPFQRGQPRVRVPISGTDIGASAEAPPVFRVVTTIDDPGPPRSSAIADVILGGCIGVATYVCDINEIRYPGPKVLSGSALADLLSRKPTLTTMTVHLQSYSAGGTALVAPGGPQ